MVFAIHRYESAIGIYVSPPSWSPLPPPSLPHLSRLSQSTAFGCPVSYMTHWLSILYMVCSTEWLHFYFSLSCIGEGNGNPLQCYCLENPRDWGAWWAAVYGVTQSQTRLKWLSNICFSAILSNHLTLFFSHWVQKSVLYICVLEGEVLTAEPPGKSQGHSLEESGSQSWSSRDVWFCWPWRRNQPRHDLPMERGGLWEPRATGLQLCKELSSKGAWIGALSWSVRSQLQWQLVGPWTENPATLCLDSWPTDTVRE